jgi:hypothetical protein
MQIENIALTRTIEALKSELKLTAEGEKILENSINDERLRAATEVIERDGISKMLSIIDAPLLEYLKTKGIVDPKALATSEKIVDPDKIEHHMYQATAPTATPAVKPTVAKPAEETKEKTIDSITDLLNKKTSALTVSAEGIADMRQVLNIANTTAKEVYMHAAKVEAYLSKIAEILDLSGVEIREPEKVMAALKDLEKFK